METDKILNEIIKFTDQAHGAQLRKYSGERYIVHPVRVMEICKYITHDIAILSAALLHDVLEDTPVTKDAIYQFLLNHMDEQQAAQTLGMVVDLTDVYIKDKFPQLNRKTRKSKEVERLSKIQQNSQTIKYADIIDNSLDISENDVDFARVYLREMLQLLLKMDKGHTELLEKALATVQNCLKKFKA
ncbi:MAG: HD domain-containing protein [Bacteroidota bacterium]|nr:HD domain-containing protein [Bacteroidota bacterium]